MKYYILLVLLISSMNIQGQDKYWVEQFGVDFINAIHKIEITNDSIITGIGGYFSSEDFMARGFFFQMDLNGNLINTVTYEHEEGELFFTDFVATPAGYAISCTIFEGTFATDEFHEIVLLLIDTEGNELSRHHVEQPEIYNALSNAIILTEDNNYIIVDLKHQGYDGWPYAVKLDNNGTVIWEQTYGDFDNYNTITDIIAIPGEDNYYIYGYVNYLPAPGVNSDLYLAKISGTTGEIIGDQEFIFDLSDKDYSTSMLYDGGELVFLGGYSNPNGSAYIIKIDTLGNIVWLNDEDFFYSAGGSGLTKTNDGHYIAVGGHDPFIPDAALVKNLHLIKFNADTGDIMWLREYGGSYYDYGYDLAISPDGGYIVAGRQDTLGGASAWVLKLNCMGLLTEPQASFTHTLEGLELYLQNTSQYVYPDSTDGGYYLLNYGDGSPAQTITTDSLSQFSHGYQSAGSYTITLTAIVCNDTSTYTQAVEVYPVGINDDGWGNNGRDVVTTLCITSQTLHYQLPPNQTHGNLLVYNLSGQLVDNIPIGATQGQIPINTTQWPSGLYLVQLQGAGGQHLASAKLVVE